MASNEIFRVLPGVIFGALFVLFFQYGMRYVLTYRLTDRSVQVVLFGIAPLTGILYERIKEVENSEFRHLVILATRWDNKLVAPGIIIFARGRLLPVTLTPNNPDEFAREVRRRVYQKTGWLP